jgi:competence protein ComEC
VFFLVGLVSGPSLPAWPWAAWVGLSALLLTAGMVFAWRTGALLVSLAGALALGIGASGAGRDVTVPEPGAHVLEGTIEQLGLNTLVLEVGRLDDQPARLRVALGGEVEGLVEGQRVRVTSRLRPMTFAANDGEWSRAAYLERRGQVASGGFERSKLVLLDAGPAWRRALARVHGTLAAQAKEVISDVDACALVLTLAAGERAMLGDELEDVFARSGLAHVLSVSGLHVAVIAFTVFAVVRWALTRRMARWNRVRDARALAAPLSIPLVWGYVLFTGLQAPAVRSAVMCTFVLLGWALRRRSDPLNGLAFALFAMTAVDPATPYDLSVQLSFVAVLAMIWLSPLARAAIPVKPPSPATESGLRLRLARAREAVLQSAASSIAVTTATTPLVLLAFQRVSVAGLGANIVALPISGVLTMAAAASAALHVIAPPLATPALWVAGVIARVFLTIARLFSGSHSAFTLPAPGPMVMALWWLGLLALVFGQGRWRLFALATPTALALLLVTGHTRPDRVDVTFLSVGHGDATVISSGNHHALIDGGGVPDGLDTGKRFVLPFLRQHHVSRLDLVALSHAHPDHALGLISTLEVLPTARLWLPLDVGRGDLVQDLMAAAGDAKIEEVEAGDAPFQLGAATIEALGPHGARGESTENDRSMVLRVTHGAVTFLLTGDLEEDGEALLDPGPVTVMKAPHHGSDTSSTAELLAKAHPRFVVFCVGVNNRYHFPREEVVERYQALGSRCYRTDFDGAVTFHSDGHDVTVETFGPRQLEARRSISRRASEAGPDDGRAGRSR